MTLRVNHEERKPMTPMDAKNTLAFLDNAKKEPVDEEALTRLKKLAVFFQESEKEVEVLEQKLKDKKEVLRALGEVEIPDLLHQYGLSEIRLDNGAKIIVKEKLQVSVPEEKNPAFMKFLKEKNAEDLVKLQFAFDRMPVGARRELLTFLEKGEYAFDMKEGVHPQTLLKFFRDLLGVGQKDREDGVADGRYLRLEDVKDVANLFMFWSTSIKG